MTSQSVTFQSAPPGPEAPKQEAPPAAASKDQLPENIADVPTLVKSYKELQAELTRVKQGKGLEGAPPAETNAPNEHDPSIPEAPSAEEAAKTAEDDAAKNAAKKAGVSLDTYQQEFNTTGDVSAESRDKLAKDLEGVLGPQARDIIDQYIDGRKNAFINDSKAIKAVAGGDEEYSTLVNWASGNLSKEEITAYNRAVNSGDRAAAMFAVEGLRARFEKVHGREPALLKGSFTPPGSGLPKFKSTAEMTAAMKDPRYKTDEAYRNEVMSRL